MNRREFLASAAALAAAPTIGGCATAAAGKGGRILFGACRSLTDAKLMASIGYDFVENGVAAALSPDKDAEWWKKQKEMILSLPIPVRSCNGFLQHFLLFSKQGSAGRVELQSLIYFLQLFIQPHACRLRFLQDFAQACGVAVDGYGNVATG